MTTISVDRYDLALLEALQRDGHATHAGLGERVHLSGSQVSRRIQSLQDNGVIKGYAALLDPATIGLGVTAYAHVILERHGDASVLAFEQVIGAMPEVLECFSVTGEFDYILRIVAPDLAAFSAVIMKRLLTLPGVAQVKTNIALQKIKETHVLPLAHVTQPVASRQRIRFSDH